MKGSKRKRSLTEGDTTEGPTEPFTPFDLQARNTGTRCLDTQSGPLAGGSGVERLHAANMCSFQRAPDPNVQAPAPITITEDDKDDDRERPAKRLRISDARLVCVQAAEGLTNTADVTSTTGGTAAGEHDGVELAETSESGKPAASQPVEESSIVEGGGEFGSSVTSHV